MMLERYSAGKPNFKSVLYTATVIASFGLLAATLDFSLNDKVYKDDSDFDFSARRR